MNDNRQGTALVTGASSGIGEAFAKELASRNYDLVIIARRKDRLLELVEELKSNYSISVDVIPADISTEKGIERVEEYIKKAKNLDLLINNAGFGTKGNFSDVSSEKSINMINLHVLAATRFCRAVLPDMIKRKKAQSSMYLHSQRFIQLKVMQFIRLPKPI
ncbi:MAG: SDR family NAD(P)-dependent oxidoreductase [Candidatus Atribacteria bacterium]|nr:SDR family NAD(P)-dependent oxidoreductase [Candidatus Atribacteria bacterium]